MRKALTILAGLLVAASAFGQADYQREVYIGGSDASGFSVPVTGSNGTNNEVRLVNANGNDLGVDTSTRVPMTVDYAHHEIHAGSHYALKGWVDITTSATNTFLIVVPDTAKTPHVIYTFNAEAEMTLTVYENPTVSATGAVMTAYNNDRNSTNTPGVTFWSTPVYTGGTNIWSAKVGSGNKIGGGVRGDSEYILLRGAKYTFNVLNNSAQTKWFDYEFLWYEHTPKTD